ncbi:MAG: type II and III secretion system protein family protein [Parvularculaceae bacterium]|nr:type II and III secretion system protein family protein [Parvularculaceae bacterium]
MSIRTMIRLTASIAALVAAAPAAAADAATKADREVVINLNADGGPAMADVDVAAGKAVVLRFDRPIADVLVGNPETADIIPLTDRSIYVIGKEVGGTSLTLFARGKQLAGVIDLNVTHDLFGLKKRLFDMMPNEQVEVRADGSAIILSGAVSDSNVSSKASALAANFAGKGGQVVNMMSVKQSQQVMLAVRFAEVKRSALKDVGISTDAFFNSGKEIGAFQTGRPLPQMQLPPGQAGNGIIKDLISDPEKFGAAFGSFALGDVTFDLLLDALEKKGIASILAEPNLIAVSGQPASFLAGGEFPVPVGVDTNGRILIEFKEFGVRLGFTPTVLGGTINLVVEPEVSELDRQNGIILDDIVIPGLTTRRTKTTVDLKNGQSFSIAGMLQRKFIDEIDQMPGVGDVPVLGALARSAAYRREDTELAIIITAYLVEPSTLSELTTPQDHMTFPHELELFLLGRTEGAQWLHGRQTANRIATGDAVAADTSPGVDGPVGFVVK